MKLIDIGYIISHELPYGNKKVESLHPLDAELNLPPERYSLELRRRVAENAAKNSFDETVDTMNKTTGGHIPKRQVEELTPDTPGMTTLQARHAMSLLKSHFLVSKSTS